ncbi:PRC-barrel domain protein [Sulfitobacter sp. THAF37]|uniref:PRC-barrel domain-containing protein n=1 Tax=Sulfitobacter sp. THAF37 TaxID=2587855 RepID=UPI001268479C|nr:PRC-barrel domain-containing protein [Sulfitobacter sp. THAF37]QFT59753.1 PRC-barrel domain protein [Sulfitobacter sp. THAF37]
MKSTLITATTLLAASTTLAAAQQQMDPSNVISADQITDGHVYRMDVTEGDTVWTDNASYTEVDASWNRVGDIEDVLFDRNGQIVGVLAEIGGFLDIGDRDVILPLENVRFAGSGQTIHYVTDLTEEELNNLPEVDEDMWDD